MSSTTTLSSYDRQRLMRSTRKLGAVLGTTPQLEFESNPSLQRATSRAQHRQARILGDSPSSSHAVSGTNECKGNVFMTLKTGISSERPLPRPLVLRLQAVPRSRGASVSSLMSPTTPSAFPSSKRNSVPFSPLSPTPPFSNSDLHAPSPPPDYRRQKMAKLARTLGENVPPELVFRNTPSTSYASVEEDLKKSRRRSCSVGSFPTPSVHLQESPRSSLDEKKKSKKVAAIELFQSRHQLTRSSSVQAKAPEKVVEIGGRPSVDAAVGCGRRKEREWSGEWNADDMNHVISALRDL